MRTHGALMALGMFLLCATPVWAQSPGSPEPADAGIFADPEGSVSTVRIEPFVAFDLTDFGGGSTGFMTVGEPISLAEVWEIARPAVFESAKSAGGFEEYAVIGGSVIDSKLVERWDVRPPGLFPYGQYTIRVDRAVGVAVDLHLGEETDVVAMFPATYKNGGVGGVYCSHCDDARVPLSVGLDVIAIAFRSKEGRGHSYYQPELWPLFHATFVVFENPDGHWVLLVPDWGREYDVATAAAAGDSVPVPIEAWHGVIRRIEGSTEEIFDLFVRAAKDASEP